MDDSSKKPSLHNAKVHIEEAASEVLEAGKKRANEIYEESIKKVTQAEVNIEECANKFVWKIKENPLTSVLIAGGIGYLLAKIMKK
ncbi:TPA: hypothetical protein ACPSKY_002280 [Legionella bozemanae]|uniref:hypothetical protein n=1 Tax=Legionella bozemanae TaxID=447 RepID=UPI001041932B|nr:hypothetical protein [Legionella bozemanae]